MHSNGLPEDPAHDVYRGALLRLRRLGIPFLVGGAFALESYTQMVRRTKDLDLFVRPVDCEAALRCLADIGFTTEIKFEHWLGKAFNDECSIDVIFSSGNGLCTVDDGWFQHAKSADVLGVDVKIVPPEEMLWSKAFVMERHRYDGGDVAHLLQARAAQMDWARLLARFDKHWRVLFSHVILFGYIYPAQRLKIPDWFMKEMMRRLGIDMQCLPADRRVCQGTLLSWSQYLTDLDRGAWEDARRQPRGPLTEEETKRITDVLQREQDEQKAA